MKELTITVDTDGTATINLKGFEQDSPKVARMFEDVLGRVEKVDWNPKAHNHVHAGHVHRN